MAPPPREPISTALYVALLLLAAVAGYLSVEYAVPQYNHPCAVSPDCGGVR